MIGDAPKDQRIRPANKLRRPPMKFLIRDHRIMVDAPIKGDIDGISQGSHDMSLS
jgi:hypothetical protein